MDLQFYPWFRFDFLLLQIHVIHYRVLYTVYMNHAHRQTNLRKIKLFLNQGWKLIYVINPAHQNFFWLVKKTLGLVHARFSLPKWQAVKLTFFAPCKQCSMLLTFFIPGEKTKYFQGTKALHPDILERVRDSAINIDRKRNG